MRTPSFKTLALCALLAAAAVACSEKEKDDNSNTAVVPNLTINGITWADCNVDGNQTFAARPDMYTKFYQWNRATAWSATDETVTGWNSTPDTSPTWTVNPCPAGWRLPTVEEYQALHDAGSTRAAANTRGNAVAGRFYGTNHATASLPDSMTGCVFFPASGLRVNTNGALYGQGIFGHGWSSTQVSSANGYNLTFGSSVSGLAGNNSKSYGFPVRCVR